ncbi:putative porin [Psychrobacter sp. PL19]|uniref:porin n=1 Tax=Psychrobacter sp. PL19 TaxID=2760711 RepID=UPI001AE80598
MKKLLLATAIAALSVSAANAAPTVYGKAFVGMDYVNTEIDGQVFFPEEKVTGGTPIPAGKRPVDSDENTFEINSYSSRIGFKGAEAITANTDVIYQLEYGVNVDGDNGDNGVAFKSRDTYLGFDNESYGQFRFGRNTSVVDYVNNVVTSGSGYWDNLGTNNLAQNEKGFNLADSGRIDNSLIWKAPRYNGIPLDVALMYKADESFNGDTDNGFAASAMLDPGKGITFGLAYDKDVNLEGDLIRGTATVDMSKFVPYPVTVGALYQVADFDATPKDEKGYVLSAKMGLSNFAKPAAVYVQYNNTDNLFGDANSDSDQIVVGGEYQFKKNMIMHAYVGQNSANIDNAKATGDYDLFAAGGGLEYIF